MSKDSVLLKPTIQITLYSFLNVIIGFLLQIVVAYFFGATSERDSYFAAIVIPTYVTAIFTGSIGFIFLPKVVEIRELQNDDSLGVFLSSTICSVGLILISISLVGVLFSKFIIHIFIPGFSDTQSILTARLFSILFPTVIFQTLVNMFSSLYQIKSKFVRPAVSSLFANIFSLVFVIIFYKRIGIFSLAVGYLTGSFLSFVFLSRILKSFRFRIAINFKDKALLQLIKISIPLLLSGILFRSTTVFERMFASNLSEGSISFLGYASQILAVLTLLTSGGVAASSFPSISKLWIENKKDQVSSLLIKVIRVILIISIPICFILFFWSDIFIKLFFERGAFTGNVTLSVSKALTWMIGAFIFQSLGNILIKIFYISGKTVAISIISILELILYITIGFYLSRSLSYIGLAISLSVSSAANIVCSLFYINKYLVKIDFKNLAVNFSKIVLASIIAFSFTDFLYNNNILALKQEYYLLSCLIIGSFIYFFTLVALRLEEVVTMFLYLKSRYFKSN